MKNNEEYNKDLKKQRQKTSISLWRFVKDTEKKKDDEEEEQEVQIPGGPIVYENVVSQNPKINGQIVQGMQE